MRKANRRMAGKVVNPNAISVALLGRTLMSEREAAARIAPFTAAVDRIVAASESQDDWRKMFDCVNLVEALFIGRVSGDRHHEWREYVDGFHVSIEALLERREQNATSAATPQEAKALRNAVETLHEMLRAVTFSALAKAEAYVVRRIQEAMRDKRFHPGVTLVSGDRFRSLPATTLLEIPGEVGAAHGSHQPG